MRVVEQVHTFPMQSAKLSKPRWGPVWKDLSLFASICLAQLIVRRTLARRRKERIRRLNRIRLVPPAIYGGLNSSTLDRVGEGQC